ncbi:MAG: SDR family oxidoreductase [Methanoregulaceae archaeon]|nr:SDR family oxidoreductase [Methanoregulaceae archaeon]
MKYIVTGGAGFIGSHMIEAIAGSHEVVVIDNFSSGKRENLSLFGDSITAIQGSITDLPVLRDAFQGAEGIFHLGAIASVARSVSDPVATHETNLSGTLNVLLAARDCGVRKVVFASSSAIYGDEPTLPKREVMPPVPLSPYAVSKLAGEYYCTVFSELFGVKTVSLRYFNVFGPRQDPNSEYAAVIPKFITRFLDTKPPIIYGDGLQSRDFVYVKDVVRANMLAMQSSVTGTFNIGSGKSIDLNTLASTIGEIMHVRIPPIYEEPRSGDIRNSVSDITAAKKILGYETSYSLEKGLAETISWFRHQKSGTHKNLSQ